MVKYRAAWGEIKIGKGKKLIVKKALMEGTIVKIRFYRLPSLPGYAPSFTFAA
jgi:hypothetical protein